MKKKLILILSMVALMVCIFAVSVSADTIAIYPQNFEIETDSNESNLSSGTFYFDSTNGYYIGDFYITDLTLDGIIIINPLAFKTYLNTFSSYTEFNELMYSQYESSVSLIGYLCSMTEDEFNYFYNYSEITEEDLTEQYNQGKIDGVSEYKASEEYSTALTTKYDEGVTAGIEQGKVDGVSEYKASEEYANALNAQYTKGVKSGELTGYDEGYADGFNDGQVEEDGADESTLDISKIFPSIILVSLITISVLVYFAFRKKKTK